MTAPALLTPAEVAALLGRTERSLRNWRYRGGGPPFVKLGDSPASPVAYDAGEVARWLAERPRFARTHEPVAS